mgnify:CR=1 FL=1
MNTKLNFETIDMLSKGITQVTFRSGPIEKCRYKCRLKVRLCKALQNQGCYLVR